MRCSYLLLIVLLLGNLILEKSLISITLWVLDCNYFSSYFELSATYSSEYFFRVFHGVKFYKGKIFCPSSKLIWNHSYIFDRGDCLKYVQYFTFRSINNGLWLYSNMWTFPRIIREALNVASFYSIPRVILKEIILEKSLIPLNRWTNIWRSDQDRQNFTVTISCV